MERTVLFVDDEPERFEWLRILMERKGIRLRIVNGVDRAMSEIRRIEDGEDWPDRPAALVVDVMMPLGSLYQGKGMATTEVGTSFVRDLRRTSRSIRVLVYTILSRDDLPPEIFADDATKYLHKNADLADVVRIISEMLGIPCAEETNATD